MFLLLSFGFSFVDFFPSDTTRPRRLGPKRANNIRKLFNLSKSDDVRKFTVRRVVKREGKKNIVKKPKIQRLVTPRRIARKKAEYVLWSSCGGVCWQH